MKPVGAARVDVVPITLPKANRYIAAWHRHHSPLETIHGGTVRSNGGCVWFCTAAVVEGRIAGVAVAGRPTNRNSDDGQTVEVLRVASDGTVNVCSALLGACARAARAIGAARIITYTLATEPGTSLRGAGWIREADGIESCWTKGRGKARPKGSGNALYRPHLDVEKVRWACHFREPIAVTVDAITAPAPSEPMAVQADMWEAS